DDGPRRRDRLPARGGGAGQEGGPGGGRRPRREVPQRDRPDRPGDHAGLTPATAPPAPATSGVARRPVAVGRDRPVRRRRASRGSCLTVHRVGAGARWWRDGAGTSSLMWLAAAVGRRPIGRRRRRLAADRRSGGVGRWLSPPQEANG